MKRALLIISCQDDCHVDAVRPHLRSLGTEAHLLVPERLLGSSLSLDPANRRGVLHVDGDNVGLDSIGGVWFRKPEPVEVAQFLPNLSRDELDFVQAEGQEVLDGLYALLADRFWLTNPPAYRLAGRKLLQLAIAQEVGFTVPRSIVTSDVRQAMEFAATVNWDIAIKSLSWASAFRSSGEEVVQYGVYCRRLTRQEAEAGLSHVRYAPTLLQEYIPKACDLRVVAVGRDHLFPVEIDSQSNEFSAEDCRIHIRELPHRLIDAPHLVAPIHRYMDRMGLQFACFDFAVSSVTGQAVFLEANVNGQWLWMEKETGAPISRAIAGVLHDRLGA